ncbi:MAG: Holliday junction resolvase RuvX [Cellulomonadaceae bacterium]|jgi:putative Holliday junction resolvase|nr:Holliday junction resolvase RuvX [Cellulomonadaceae bacterium]
MTLPRGVRLGLDVGTVRIGVAASDPDGLIATPVTTVARSDDGSDVDSIVALVAERRAPVIYVGLPRHLSGGEGQSAHQARSFAAAIASRPEMAEVEVRLVDERLTTVTASTQMRQAGRSQKRQRSVIDQQAAVIIVQTALDAERASTRRAGEAVVRRAS